MVKCNNDYISICIFSFRFEVISITRVIQKASKNEKNLPTVEYKKGSK